MHKICTFVRTLAKSYKAKNIYDKKGEEEERCWKQNPYFYHHFDGIFFTSKLKMCVELRMYLEIKKVSKYSGHHSLKTIHGITNHGK